jgi:hypothetical protein
MFVLLSLTSWFYYFSSERHVAYNDAMSHLNISRRVFDNLTPGAAQIGSVWLPLYHLLMLPTVWIDFFWKTGFSAAIVSMSSYIVTSLYTYKLALSLGFKRKIALIITSIVALNTNLLYLQTTALTEPLFIALFTLSIYHFNRWIKHHNIMNLVGTAFFVMLSTLTRYDGWALLGFSGLALMIILWNRYKSFKAVEGLTILFVTLAALGCMLWFGWNYFIFGDPIYFATGEFSAKAQQDVLEASNDLPTKHNVGLSMLTYMYSMFSNVGVITILLGSIGWLVYIKNSNTIGKAFALISIAPLVFNVLALFLGHSVIHVPEIAGASWFNVRYGLLVISWAALFTGYLASRPNVLVKTLVPVLVMLQIGLFYNSRYIVTLDDGLWGSSQKNVKATGQWIHDYVGADNNDLILVSVASHDAVLFRSDLPMHRFIHEGTGEYWDNALANPELHAKFVIMRTHDSLDSVARSMDQVPQFYEKYALIYDDEFVDVYELKATTAALR